MSRSTSSRDEIDDLIAWLEGEIDGRKGHDLFSDLMDGSKGGRFKKNRFVEMTLRDLTDQQLRHARTHALLGVLEKLQLLD
jgi:hypothetical protein